MPAEHKVKTFNAKKPAVFINAVGKCVSDTAFWCAASAAEAVKKAAVYIFKKAAPKAEELAVSAARSAAANSLLSFLHNDICFYKADLLTVIFNCDCIVNICFCRDNINKNSAGDNRQTVIYNSCGKLSLLFLALLHFISEHCEGLFCAALALMPDKAADKRSGILKSCLELS